MACVVFKLIYLHDYHSVLLESLHVGRKERSNSSDLSVIFPSFFFMCTLCCVSDDGSIQQELFRLAGADLIM